MVNVVKVGNHKALVSEVSLGGEETCAKITKLEEWRDKQTMKVRGETGKTSLEPAGWTLSGGWPGWLGATSDFELYLRKRHQMGKVRKKCAIWQREANNPPTYRPYV